MINKIQKRIYFSLFKNFNNHFNQKYLLIHFPKTAGTLLKIEIENKKLFNQIIYFDHEQNFSRLYKRYPKHKFIIFIRNPLTWYISYYHNKFKSLKKHKLYDKNHFLDYINDLVINQSVSSIRRWHVPNKKNTIMDMVAELNNNELGFFTKVFFMYTLKDPITNLNKLKNTTDKETVKNMIGVDNIYKYENLEKFNQSVFKNTKRMIDFNRYENKGPKINFKDYYDKKIINKIMEKDKIIFDLFY